MPFGIESSASAFTSGDDQRDLRVHPPGRGVVDDDRAGGGDPGASSSEAALPQENSAMSRPEKSALDGVLDHDLAAAPGQPSARGTRRGEEAHLVEREAPLGEDAPHHGPDLARGAENPDSHRPTG